MGGEGSVHCCVVGTNKNKNYIYIYICIHDALIAGKMCLLFLRLMSGAVCTAVAKGVQHTGRAYLHVCEHICIYASIYAYTHICIYICIHDALIPGKM